MYRIRTYNQIASIGLKRFPAGEYEVNADLQQPDAILLRSHKLQTEQIEDSVRAVARAGAGTNNVPLQYCTEQGIVVFNTPGANANAVKELVLCGLLLGSRGVLPGINFATGLQEGMDNVALAARLEQEKKRFRGSELYGKTIGIIGLGAIGSLVAEAAIALGMEVLGHDPKLSVDAAWRLPNQVRKIENLSALFANSDYISLHLPALDATRGIINQAAVAAMKPGCCLLNFSRDEIVDVEAIRSGLDSGPLRMYISDFPRNELLGRSDVILMPHIGASTAEAEENCAIMAAEQLKEFLESGTIRNSVNFPHLQLDRIPDAPPHTRLAITNRNVPGMLGEVTSLLAEHDLNVLDMINKSREGIAYSLIDLDTRPDDGVIREIGARDNIIKVKLL